MSRNSVFCIAASRGQADRIVHGLKEADFSNREVSALFLEMDAGDGRASPAAAGAIRGVMAWVAGVRRVVVPGIDPLIAAGPLAAALSDATVDGVAGGLIDFGVPAAEAGSYEDRIKRGALLLAIQSGNPDRRDRAREIFKAEGAEDICTLMEILGPRSSIENAGGVLRGTAA